MNPRKPTQEEKEQLLHSILQNDYVHAQKPDEAMEKALIDELSIAVFDDYIENNERYQSKVMVVLMYRGGVGTELARTFVWNKTGELICINKTYTSTDLLN